MREPLPIDDLLPDLVAALRVHRSVVLRAPTGAGKTTRVPPALLDEVLSGDGSVIVLEPRRVAARAAARRIAEERSQRLGDDVGYQVRFDRVASRGTRLLVVTEGVLLRMLQGDPFLEGVGAVVFDEFHERRLDSDLALAMVRRVQRDVRSDLRIAVMSATLEPGPVTAYLDGCPSLESAGRAHPVDVEYLERPDDGWPSQLAERGVKRLWSRSDGDLLVFLPGVGDIHRSARYLGDWAEGVGAELAPLYGDLSPERQDAVLRPSSRRRIILATNVAETSITIPTVRAVVDTGFAHVMRYDAGCGLDRLVRERISRASAKQRAGRAGRTGPGHCLRMWTHAQHRGLASTTTPEIQRVDLAGPFLELLAWGEPDPATFEWLEPPDPASLEQARELLERLGALEAGSLTALGRELAALPLHPRLSRVLVESRRLGRGTAGARLVALLAERDPFRRLREAEWVSDSDVLDRLDALEATIEQRPTRFEVRSQAAVRGIARAADQLERESRRRPGPPDDASARHQPERHTRSRREDLRRALLVGFPDRVAQRRQGSARLVRGVMVGRRGVRLADESAVRAAELFVCIDIDAGRRGRHAEALVRQASAIERDWLPPERISHETVLRFDETIERVVADARLCYEDLALEEQRVAPDDPAAVSALLVEAAAERLDDALPLDRPDVSAYLSRLWCLADWRPDLKLPRLDEAELRERLPSLCLGRRGFDELRSLTLDELLAGVLTWRQRQQIDSLAPERMTMPTGSQVRLQYEPGRPPVLAVRIQEMFGETETPRVAGGRVPVLLHLLAPNYRPQQVTDDLASFWANTYPEVRKELRQRYPKHPWPEDPVAARPVRK